MAWIHKKGMKFGLYYMHGSTPTLEPPRALHSGRELQTVTRPCVLNLAEISGLQRTCGTLGQYFMFLTTFIITVFIKPFNSKPM